MWTRPLVPASRLRPTVILVAALACTAMGMVAISSILRLPTVQWLVASLTTGIMGALTVRLATRAPVAPSAGVMRTIGCSLLLGMANAPVAFLAVSLVDGLTVQFFGMTLMAAVIGVMSLGGPGFWVEAAIIAIPILLLYGLLFGLMLSVPVAMLMEAWRRPSPDASDATVVVLGLWLTLAVGLAALVDAPQRAWQGDVDVQRLTTLQLTAWVLGALGLAAAIAAGVRRAMRHRFVTRVALGTVPGWRVIAAPEDPAQRRELDTLPCLGATAAECEHLLTRCEQPGEGAYRRAATEWPVAWVPRTWLVSAVATARHG